MWWIIVISAFLTAFVFWLIFKPVKPYDTVYKPSVRKQTMTEKSNFGGFKHLPINKGKKSQFRYKGKLYERRSNTEAWNLDDCHMDLFDLLCIVYFLDAMDIFETGFAPDPMAEAEALGNWEPPVETHYVDPEPVRAYEPPAESYSAPSDSGGSSYDGGDSGGGDCGCD